VYLVAYDPGWAAEFARESVAVRAAMGATTVELHHIGSTAIPDICAKPIIDLLAAVADLRALDDRSAQMQALGYEVMGEFGIPGRRYFRKDDAAGERTHQIHAFQAGSPQIARHLAFRDFLRAHAGHAREYETLKLQLATLHPLDISSYADGKDAFIRDMDARAAAWRNETLSSNPP
jgi:GrpB-like predicted nucleotidyltransferase (UPF0157 family)